MSNRTRATRDLTRRPAFVTLSRTQRSRRRAGALVGVGALLAGLIAAATALAAINDTTLISRADGAAGAKAGGASENPSISSEGRYVAFQSTATNLDAADADVQNDIFLRDTQTDETTFISRGDGAGGVNGNGVSASPAVSANGSAVAFESSGNNLDDDVVDNNASGDIYVRGVGSDETFLLSRADGADGDIGDATSREPSISNDGAVAFESDAGNLSPDDGSSDNDIYVRDGTSTVLASRADGAAGTKGNGNSDAPDISGDGDFVAFESDATNLDGADTTTDNDIYVRDLASDTIELVSRADGAGGAKANAGSSDASVSDDGRYVAFTSTATNLDPADTNASPDVYVRDTVSDTTTLASRAAGVAGAKGNGASDVPRISGDGRFVAFESGANNLVPGDDGLDDVFVRDLQDHATTLVSRADGFGGANSNNTAAHASISENGLFVAFETGANNLDPADPAGAGKDVYLRELPLDQVVPDAPAMTGTDPASPADDTNPDVLGTAEAGATVDVYSTNDCTGAPAGTGVADGSGNFSIPVAVGESTTTTFKATATDGSENVSGCSASSVTFVETDPPPAPECSDGIDNDGDGKIDHPADPGCTSPADDDETDPVQPPSPECSDGIDNDGDGKIDHPADPGCTSAADNNETDPAGGGSAACKRANKVLKKAKKKFAKAKKALKKAKKRGKRKKVKKAKKKVKKTKKKVKKAKKKKRKAC